MPNKWDDHAETRRIQIESGKDLTFSRVFLPYYLNVVKELHPVSLLEVGCGTGHLSAVLSSHVKMSVAIEPSVGMHTVAKSVLQKTNVQLFRLRIEEYRERKSFDLIISHMCLQLADNIEGFISSVSALMRTDSHFVFAIPHPCFYNEYKRLFQPSEYDYMRELTKMVSFSITRDPNTQISGVPYCHRPLSRYFSVLRACNYCVVDFDEIFPEHDIQSLYGVEWDIPRYCVFHTQYRK
jgi:SAM-dependent methyltransferase